MNKLLPKILLSVFVLFGSKTAKACYFDFAAQSNFDSFVNGCTSYGGTYTTSNEGTSTLVYCKTVDNWTYTSSFPLTCPTAPPPPPQAYAPPTNVDTSTACGSLIRIDSLVLEESVAIHGTPFFLHYTSARAIGRLINRRRIVPVIPVGVEWSTNHEHRYTRVEVAGRTVYHTSTPNDPPDFEFSWDGKDQYGNLVRGSAELVINSDDGFNPPNTNEQTYTHRQRIGTYYALTAGMGGWTISDHHFYDHGDKKLYLGTGEEVAVEPIAANSGPNTLILSPNGDEVFEFNSLGLHLSTKTGIKGTTKLTFSYDTSDRLISISDQFSNTTTFTYTSGKLSSVTGPYGKVTTITTNSDGYISSITSPNSETHAMTYQTVGFPAGGLLVSFEKPNGIVSSFTYNVFGNLESDSSSAGSSMTLSSVGFNDAQNRTISTTTAEGVSKDVQITYSPIYGTYTRTESGPFDQSYTANITPSGISNESGTTSMGLVWTSGHSQDPRFTPGGYFPSYQTWATANVNRNLQTTRAATLSDPMNPFSVTNLTDTFVRNSTKTTTVAYLGSTSKFTVTSPVGRKTYQTIDSHERLVSAQHATYTPVTYTYDSRNRLASVAQSTPRTTTFSYNTDGYLQNVTNALSQVTSYTYDADGRVLTTTLPDSRVIGFTYDANGNLASVTPPGGAVHGLLSNGFDLLAKYTAPATSFFDAEKKVEKKLSAIERYFKNIAKVFSDWLSAFLPSAAKSVRTLVLDRETNFTYNNDRQLVEIDRPDGQSAQFIYSGTTGRLSGITTSAGNYTFTQNAFYDRIDQSVSPDGVTQDYTYDGPFLMTASNSGRAVGTVYFTYNNDMQVASTKVGTAAAITHTYDNDGLLTAVGNQSITRNAATGFATKATLSSASENFTYSAAFGELSSVQGKYSTSTNIYLANYTYDNIGRITQKVETVGTNSANTFVYTFDAAGRLTDVTKNGSALSTYVYDSNSNRTSQTISGVTTTATYDEQDRLRTFGTKTYAYNDSGELTSVSDSSTSPASVTTYTYDVFGNIKSVTLPNATVISYLLDGQDRRVVKKIGSTVQKQFVWFDSLRPAAELNSSGAIVSQFVYGLKGNVPDYIIKGSVRYKVMTDHLGSVVAVVHSTNGTVAQRIEYDEFGRVLSDTSPGFQPFGFSGGLYDPDTKLTLFGARSYDAEIGRWLSKDPILFAGGDTNLYGYVMNDPVNFVDPEGETAKRPGQVMQDPAGGSGGGGKGPKCSSGGYSSRGGHNTNTRPSNLPKHQKGDARRGKDKGREKGDARRPYRRK